MLLALMLAACSSESTSPTPSGSEPSSTSGNTITIKGSDSEVNVVQRLAEEFAKTHPDVRISVSGGGSGTGIAALLDGTATLANSSRDLSGTEKIEAQRRGLQLTSFVFATDGLAVVVNADNPVASLTMDQLGAIFRGEASTWDALGGSGPVSLYGRQSSSGTYDYFKKAAVKGEYGTALKQMNGSAQIVEAVRADKGAIGYVAAGYLKGEAAAGVKAVPLVAAAGAAPVSPTDTAAVLAGTYPLSRPLYQFTPGAPSAALKEFLAFEASSEGQAIVTEMGFFTIAEAGRQSNATVLGGTP